ncbi:methyl-accepting chemotaxis protein III [mine drainage metagenome]|uniref:Methyl-accepting chemotaxis protein III n=1 Tax=mine drainage metagenome TaxID=410659 RepID=A0A1J5RE96_9ZZZZ
MDEVTQQNAALVEQAAAAAESLVEQAVGLIETVSAFRLTNSTQLRTIAAPAQLRSTAPNRAITSDGLSRENFSFDEAKQAHIKWKNRLIDYIAGRSKEHLDVEKVCRDDQCPLGGWIYGHAQQHARMPAFRELRTAHAEFHESVGHIVRCVQDHNQPEAKRLLGGEFSKTSKRTIAAIDSIEAMV